MDEVVFSQTTWWGPGDEVLDTVTIGSLDVRLDDGQVWRVDPDHQDAPDGTTFSIEWEVGQEAEGAPEFSRTRVVRHRRRFATVEERLDMLEVDVGPLTAEAREEWRRQLEDPVSGHEPWRDGELMAWLERAGANERAFVEVVFAEQAPRRRVAPMAVAADAPAVALDLLEERALDQEDRKTWVDVFQAPFLAEAERAGATRIRSSRPYNGFALEAPAWLLREWAADPTFDTMGFPGRAVDTSTNDGEEIRLAMQVAQFPNHGYDGSKSGGTGSSPTHNKISVMIVDNCLDIDHPAWNDGSGGTSRLKKHWDLNANDVYVETQTGCASAGAQHGTRVTGIAVGDLMDDQVPSMSLEDRKARSGLTWESTFEFVDATGSDNPGYSAPWDVALDRNADIVNRSQTCHYQGQHCNYCTLEGNVNDRVDDLYLDGRFVVLPAGNWRSGTSCRVSVPATAAGSFTVGGYDATDVADLQNGPLWIDTVQGSPAGNDSKGRALIDLTAPAGRDHDFIELDDAYSSGGGDGTSYAAPAVAGAAANVLDRIMERHGAGVVAEPGYLHAVLLTMGDGQARTGSLQPDSPPDPDWGMGRARMRLFTEGGMDSPWRVRLCSRVVDAGETNFVNCSVNPNDNDVNQALPADVDQLRVTSFWFEPNLAAGETPATLKLSARKDGTIEANTAPQHPIGAQRLWFSQDVGGHLWQSEGDAVNVPASTRAGYYQNLTKRKLYTVVLWEDLDRDEDQDGPEDGIQ